MRTLLLSLTALLLTACSQPTADDLFASIRAQRLARVERIAKKNSPLLAARNSENRTPLLLAAEIKNQAIVKALLQAGAQPNERDETGATPLHLAAGKRLPENVSALLEGGADPSLRDGKGHTPLMTAAASGNLESVKLLLSKGADVRALNDEGETALHSAIRSSQLPVVEAILSAGADANVRDRSGRKPVELAGDEGSMEIFDFLQKKGQLPVYDGPIHQAVSEGNLAQIRGLLSRKRTLANEEGGRGNRPIHFSCLLEGTETAELLLSNGAVAATPNGVGNTALHECAFLGNVKVARLLLARGVPAGAKNRKGETALHLAVREGYPEVAELLLKAGADPNATDNAKRTPLSGTLEPKMIRLLLQFKAAPAEVERMVHGGCRSCADLLIEKGGTIAAPAHAAAYAGGVAALAPLVEKNAGLVNERDFLGQTPIHYAALAGRAEMVQFLLAKGADPLSPSLLPAIHKAAAGNSKEVLDLFLARSIAIDLPTEDTEATPLHLAAREGATDAVAFLLQKGAKVNALTRVSETPLILLAGKSLSVEAARLLIDAKVERRVETDAGETALDIVQRRAKEEKDPALSANARAIERLILTGPK